MQSPMNTSSTNQTRQPIFNKNELFSSQQRLDLMAVYINEAERIYYQKQSIFGGELSQMWKKHRQLVRNQVTATALINLMQQRLDKFTDRWRDLYHYRVDYYLRMHMMILWQRRISMVNNKARIQMYSYPILSLVQNIRSMINNYNYYVEDQAIYHHVKCIFHHLMHRSMM